MDFNFWLESKYIVMKYSVHLVWRNMYNVHELYLLFSPHFQSLETPFSASYLEMACQKLCWWKESRKLFGRRQRKSLLKWWWSGGPLLFPLFLSTIHTMVKYCEKGVIGILLPKLFRPTVRKYCSSDREKLVV